MVASDREPKAQGSLDAGGLTKLTSRVLAGRAFAIKTAPIVSYFTTVMEAISDGALGAIVVGLPRLGKSMGTRWILATLSELFGGLPCLEVPLRKRLYVSEGGFFLHMLTCAKHKHASVSGIDAKRSRLSKWLAVRAKRSPLNTVVMFIDEAHLLTDLQYMWLLNISNELDVEGCRLFCLLVGQRELLSKKGKLMGIEGGEQIVGRFMSIVHYFRGIGSEEELSASFRAYAHTVYPMGSGMQFPANYIPIAMESGFDFGSVAPAAWSECQRIWSKAGLPCDKVEVPMAYVARMCARILNALVASDAPDLRVPADIVIDAIRRSGYSESVAIRKLAADMPARVENAAKDKRSG